MKSGIVVCCTFWAAAIFLAAAVFLSNFAVVLSSPAYLNSLARSTSTWQDSDANIGSQYIAGSITADVLSYITGKSAFIAGSSYFREEELFHLADVRRKVGFFFLFFYSLLFSAAAAFLAVFALGKNLRNSLAVAGKILFASGALAASVSIILFLLSLNFDASFTGFHEIFFAGGQWQFPSNYLVVNLFTADFFASVAKAAVAAAFAEGIVLMLASVAVGKYWAVFSKPISFQNRKA